MPPEAPLLPRSPAPQPTPSPAPTALPNVNTSELQKALAEVALKASDPMIKGMTSQLAVTLVEAVEPSTPPVRRALLLERIEHLTDTIRNHLEKENDPEVRKHLIKLVGDPVTGVPGLLQEFADAVRIVILRAGGPGRPPVRPPAPDDPIILSNPFSAPSGRPWDPSPATSQEIKILDPGKKAFEDALHLGASLLAEKKRAQQDWAKRAAADEEARHKELIKKIIDHVVAIGPKNGGDGGALTDIINAVSAPFGGLSEGEAVARAEHITARVLKEAEERRLLQFPEGQKAADALHAAAA